MSHGLPENAARKICSVLAHYPQVAQAVLYGSRAKGSYKHGSDIDLTLRGGAALTQGVLYKIIFGRRARACAGPIRIGSA